MNVFYSYNRFYSVLSLNEDIFLSVENFIWYFVQLDFNYEDKWKFQWKLFQSVIGTISYLKEKRITFPQKYPRLFIVDWRVFDIRQPPGNFLVFSTSIFWHVQFFVECFLFFFFENQKVDDRNNRREQPARMFFTANTARFPIFRSWLKFLARRVINKHSSYSKCKTLLGRL